MHSHLTANLVDALRAEAELARPTPAGAPPSPRASRLPALRRRRRRREAPCGGPVPAA